jgi:hypothetical protein
MLGTGVCFDFEAGILGEFGFIKKAPFDLTGLWLSA